jgi:hypothetical protein
VNKATSIVNLLCVLNTIPEEKQYCVDVLEYDNSEEDVGKKYIGHLCCVNSSQLCTVGVILIVASFTKPDPVKPH